MQLATKLWARLATCATYNNMAELSGTWTVLSSRIVHDRRRDKTRFTNCRSPEPCIKLICKLCGRSWGRSFRTRIARERITRGLIPAKRRLIASFKLALVKVCQGQGQGQFKIPDPATATALARVRSRVRGSVSAASRLRRDYRSPARSLWGSTVLYLYLYLKIYNFFAGLCNVLIMFWWILYAPLVVADLDFDHGFRRLLRWSSMLSHLNISASEHRHCHQFSSAQLRVFRLQSSVCGLGSAIFVASVSLWASLYI